MNPDQLRAYKREKSRQYNAKSRELRLQDKARQGNNNQPFKKVEPNKRQGNNQDDNQDDNQGTAQGTAQGNQPDNLQDDNLTIQDLMDIYETLDTKMDIIQNKLETIIETKISEETFKTNQPINRQPSIFFA